MNPDPSQCTVYQNPVAQSFAAVPQVASMLLTVLLVCVSAFAGCAAFELAAHTIGLASIHLSPGACAVIALALSVHPFFLAYIPVILPPVRLQSPHSDSLEI